MRADGQMCEVCHYLLVRARLREGDREIWMHPGGRPFDHKPVPIPEDETGVMVCDFCGVPTEEKHSWTYFSKRTEIILGALQASNNELWLACNPCHELIEDDDWEGLATRSEAEIVVPAHLLPKARQSIRVIQRAFALNRVGSALRGIVV